jgi:hypothetical protein
VAVVTFCDEVNDVRTPDSTIGKSFHLDDYSLVRNILRNILTHSYRDLLGAFKITDNQ